ncbi:MAG: hypothetical protein OXO53_13045, partial [Chloroflexota bacterium]|nr:hypothetical protein [Chloroflexota bacterium]
GLWGSIGYWIAQQGVERANQPWYYYIIGLSVYEFAIAVPALLGSFYLLARRRTIFDVAIVGWTWLSFAIFSFAGERMPWLLMGIAVPCAFVAGRVAGTLAEHAAASGRDTRAIISAYAGGIILAAIVPFFTIRFVLAAEPIRLEVLLAGVGGVVLAIALVLAFKRGGVRAAALSPDGAAAPDTPPVPLFQMRESRAERRRAARGERRGNLGASVLGSLLAPPRAAVHLTSRAVHAMASPLSAASVTLALLALGALTVAFAMTVFFSARASYSYDGFERPRELLVYSQTGQETPYAAECIDRLATSAGLGRGGISILADNHDNFAWQWRWYLRDYPSVAYRTLNTDPLTEPPSEHLVMMSIWSEDANREHLANYERLGELHTLWWFPNYAYGNVTPGDVLSGAFSSEGWRTAIDYQLQRDLASAMQFSRGAIYVRNDLTRHTQGCESFLSAQSLDDEAAG